MTDRGSRDFVRLMLNALDAMREEMDDALIALRSENIIAAKACIKRIKQHAEEAIDMLTPDPEEI